VDLLSDPTCEVFFGDEAGFKSTHLPSYSPDFNLIERLCQHLKKHHLAGFITKDGEALGEKIFQAIRSLLQSPEIIHTLCRIHSE
jgi:transposase